MKKQEKETFVENLQNDIKDAAAIYLVDYTGLSVKLQQDLKKKLREVDASMVVVKNTLLKIAGQNAKLPDEALTDTVLSGQTALIVANVDPIAPLQIVAKFVKENEIPQFKVGIVENSFQDKTALIKLASLPGKEVLYAQTVGAIGAPLYGLVGTLQGNIQKLLFILKSKAEQV